MFLHRTTSTTSLSSFRTTDSSYSRPRLAGAAAGWSAPSVASDSVNVSAQVHYSYLASQYRAQSDEKGLGIASRSYTLQGNNIPGQSNEPEASTSKAGSSSNTSTQATHTSRRLESLFAGSRSNKPSQKSETTTRHASPSKSKAGAGAPRHSSTRGYAKQRLKAQEALEDVIAAATDTGRLKWEAKVSRFAISKVEFTSF